MLFTSVHHLGNHVGLASVPKAAGLALFLVVLVVVIIRYGAGAA